MTCWMVAFCPAAAWRNVSLWLSSVLSACAQSSERNFTATVSDLRVSMGGVYRRAGAFEYRRRLLEEVGIREVYDVVQEPNGSRLGLDVDAVQTRVLGEEEHLLPQAQDPTDVGV